MQRLEKKELNWWNRKYFFVVENYKYLGIWIDEKLNFKFHLKKLKEKVINRCNIL